MTQLDEVQYSGMAGAMTATALESALGTMRRRLGCSVLAQLQPIIDAID
jgi:hypothetical protein